MLKNKTVGGYFAVLAAVAAVGTGIGYLVI